MLFLWFCKGHGLQPGRFDPETCWVSWELYQIPDSYVPYWNWWVKIYIKRLNKQGRLKVLCLFLVQINPVGLFCNGTFDKFACWPHSFPGIISVSCPSYLPWIREGELFVLLSSFFIFFMFSYYLFNWLFVTFYALRTPVNKATNNAYSCYMNDYCVGQLQMQNIVVILCLF